VEKSIEEMRNLRISLQFATFMMLFFFVACTKPTTIFSTIWKDETCQVQPKKVLVINAYKNPASRKFFEDGFETALKDLRIDAVVSYTVTPDMSDPVLDEKVAIVIQAKAVGADTVLINKPLETTRKDINISTGSPVWKTHINTRTDVYDMKSYKLIMSVSAEKRLQKGKPYTDQIQSYTKDLVNMMSQHRLFRGR
jgi:hypothetical protein